LERNGLIKAQAILYALTDVEGRRRGERTGLDTLVVVADNDECHKSGPVGLDYK